MLFERAAHLGPVQACLEYQPWIARGLDRVDISTDSYKITTICMTHFKILNTNCLLSHKIWTVCKHLSEFTLLELVVYLLSSKLHSQR